MYRKHPGSCTFTEILFVYRLDKLQKSTGLDLRVFEDAINVQDRAYGCKIYEIYGIIRVLDLYRSINN